MMKPEVLKRLLLLGSIGSFSVLVGCANYAPQKVEYLIDQNGIHALDDPDEATVTPVQRVPVISSTNPLSGTDSFSRTYRIR